MHILRWRRGSCGLSVSCTEFGGVRRGEQGERPLTIGPFSGELRLFGRLVLIQFKQAVAKKQKQLTSQKLQNPCSDAETENSSHDGPLGQVISTPLMSNTFCRLNKLYFNSLVSHETT